MAGSRRHPPPPTKFAVVPTQRKAAPGGMPVRFAPPPTRFGPPVAQPFLGCLSDCVSGIASLLGLRNTNDANQGNVNYTPMQQPMVRRARFNDGATSQDTVAKSAHSIGDPGNYCFGFISCCTAVYFRGGGYSTVGHHFGTRYKAQLTREMDQMIQQAGGGGPYHVKILFSAEASQNHSALTESQKAFITRLTDDIDVSTVDAYVYDAYKTQPILNQLGDFVINAESYTKAN